MTLFHGSGPTEASKCARRTRNIILLRFAVIVLMMMIMITLRLLRGSGLSGRGHSALGAGVWISLQGSRSQGGHDCDSKVSGV